jgi:hypothetical protein
MSRLESSRLSKTEAGVAGRFYKRNDQSSFRSHSMKG